MERVEITLEVEGVEKKLVLEAEQFIGSGPLIVKTHRGEIKVWNTDYVLTLGTDIFVVPETFLLHLDAKLVQKKLVEKEESEVAAKVALMKAEVEEKRRLVSEKEEKERKVVEDEILARDLESELRDLDAKLDFPEGTLKKSKPPITFDNPLNPANPPSPPIPPTPSSPSPSTTRSNR